MTVQESARSVLINVLSGAWRLAEAAEHRQFHGGVRAVRALQFQGRDGIQRQHGQFWHNGQLGRQWRLGSDGV